MLRDYLRRAYRTLVPLIFSKKNYKFFLMSSLMDLDAKTQKLFHASNALSAVIKPVLMPCPFGERLLVIAPHHDDEAIGCGGTVLAHLARGKEVQVVIVQDGSGAEGALGMTREELIAVREEESRACARLMGNGPPLFLRFSHVDETGLDSVAAELERVVDAFRPDTIFTPFVLDTHREHACTAAALARALRGNKGKADVYSYEVWGLCIPNTAVAIDEFMDRKCELINCFASQTKGNDYAHAFRGLAMYHSLQFGARDIRYVERFFALPDHEYADFVDRVFAAEEEGK